MARTKSKYGSPRKGTKKRIVVNMLLRKQGATTTDLIEAEAIIHPGMLSRYVDYLEDQCGFDIRRIGSVPCPERRGPHNTIYRIVGRRRWDGSYRSFVSTKD